VQYFKSAFDTKCSQALKSLNGVILFIDKGWVGQAEYCEMTLTVNILTQ
jgi:hypothetical protein